MNERIAKRKKREKEWKQNTKGFQHPSVKMAELEEIVFGGNQLKRKGSKRGIFCRFRDTISFSPFLWFWSFVDTTFQVTENKTIGNKNSVRDMRTKVSSKDTKKKTRTTTTDDRQTDWTKSHHKKKEKRRECHKKRLFSSLRFFFFLCINKKWKHNENSRMNFNDS